MANGKRTLSVPGLWICSPQPHVANFGCSHRRHTCCRVPWTLLRSARCATAARGRLAPCLLRALCVLVVRRFGAPSCVPAAGLNEAPCSTLVHAAAGRWACACPACCRICALSAHAHAQVKSQGRLRQVHTQHQPGQRRRWMRARGGRNFRLVLAHVRQPNKTKRTS